MHEIRNTTATTFPPNSDLPMADTTLVPIASYQVDGEPIPHEDLSEQELKAINNPQNQVALEASNPKKTISGIEIANLHSSGSRTHGNMASQRYIEAEAGYDRPRALRLFAANNYVCHWPDPEDNALYQTSKTKQVDFREEALIYFLDPKSTDSLFDHPHVPKIKLLKNESGVFIDRSFGRDRLALQKQQKYQIKSKNNYHIELSGPGINPTVLAGTPYSVDLELEITASGQLRVTNNSSQSSYTHLRSDSHYSTTAKQKIKTTDCNLENLKFGDLVEIESMLFVVDKVKSHAEKCSLLDARSAHRADGNVLRFDFDNAKELYAELKEYGLSAPLIYKPIKAGELRDGDELETTSGHKVQILGVEEDPDNANVRLIDIKTWRPGEQHTDHTMLDRLILHKNSKISDIASLSRN